MPRGRRHEKDSQFIVAKVGVQGCEAFVAAELLITAAEFLITADTSPQVAEKPSRFRTDVRPESRLRKRNCCCFHQQSAAANFRSS
jgi:hypothetical protein